MADDLYTEPKASEEPYTRIKTLGRGAFGEAVLYRKTEVSLSTTLSCCFKQKGAYCCPPIYVQNYVQTSQYYFSYISLSHQRFITRNLKFEEAR